MITLVTVISSLGWALQGVALDSFETDTLIESETAYRFTPTNNDGYVVSQIDWPTLRPSSELQLYRNRGPIELGFSFPFYGESYTQIFPHGNGLAGFQDWFLLADILHEQSHSPVIIPAAVGIKPAAHASIGPADYSGIYTVESANHITIHWHDFVSQFDDSEAYSFRVRLDRSGVIDFIYDVIPDQSSPDIDIYNTVIFLSGISPGRTRTALSPISWLDGDGVKSARLQPLRQDFVEPLQVHLDAYFRPLAIALLLTAFIIVAVYPVLFLHMLILPLGRLMQAIEQVKKGRSTALKTVGRDEISQISETMNAMSVTLYELVDDLETKVEERASRIANLAWDNARLTERDRLSAELHDSVAQTLFASNLISDRIPDQITKSPDRAIENIERVKQLNQDALKEVRNLLEDLRPAAIAEDGLCTLLQKVADKFCTHASLTLEFHSGGNARLPEKVQMVFLRVLQECLHNIHKHAEATSVDIECDALETQAILIVRDNGKGFQTTKVSMGSFGLEIMRERLQSIAADLDINSVPGQGTTITVIWFGETHV